MWDIKRADNDELTARINVRDFFRLARLAKKTRCRIYVLKRVGFIFIFSKLKKRKAFLLGALLFIGAVYLMSSFIWSMEIKCPDDDLSISVMEDLRQWGLKEYKNVAWAQIEIRGSKLTVELVKKQLPPKLEQNTPCDIIASKDGIVEEIIHFKGEALVKPGQTVSKGDVLITGRIVLQQDCSEQKDKGEGDILLVHAQGIIKARVWYQKAVKVPLVKTQKTPTGKSKKSIVFQTGDHIFSLQWGSIPYTLYDRKTLKEIAILPIFEGALKLNVVEYLEMEITKEFLGIEEASSEAEAELILQLGDISKDNKITQKKMEFMLDSEEKAVIGSIIIEVVEDIGQKKEIN